MDERKNKIRINNKPLKNIDWRIQRKRIKW